MHDDDPAALVAVRGIGVDHQQYDDPTGAADGLPAITIRVDVGARYRVRITGQNQNPGRQRQSVLGKVPGILVWIPGPVVQNEHPL